MSDALVEVRVDRPQYRSGGEQYERGDTLTVSKRELDRHPNSLEKIGEVTGEAEGEDVPDGPSGKLPFLPPEHSVSEIEERIAEIDDVEAVRALRNAEQQEQDDPRTTAVEAFDDRIDELEG
jgi:hypothetical protein